MAGQSKSRCYEKGDKLPTGLRIIWLLSTFPTVYERREELEGYDVITGTRSDLHRCGILDVFILVATRKGPVC